MHVRPAPGLKVRDPITKRHLPDHGKEVPSSTYWLRRVADGDVVVFDAEPQRVVQADQIPDSASGEE